MKAVDGSYTVLTPDAARQLKALGYELWIQCLWTGLERPWPRISNLWAAKDAGLLIAGYISVTASRDGHWHVEEGAADVPQYLWDNLQLVFVDVELPHIPLTTIRQAVDDLALELYGRKHRAIYTSYHAWVDFLGNPTSFTDCLLWNAYWDRNPDIDFPALPYGGWMLEQLVGEQYSGDTEIAGVHVDQDEFNHALLLGQTEAEMAEIDDLKEQVTALQGQVTGHLWVEAADAFKRAYMNRLIAELLAGTFVVEGYDDKGWPKLVKRADDGTEERRRYR